MKLSYELIQYFVGKRGPGQDFFFIGGGGVMSTDKFFFWREEVDLERQVALDMCTKHVLCLREPMLT